MPVMVVVSQWRIARLSTDGLSQRPGSLPGNFFPDARDGTFPQMPVAGRFEQV